MCSILIFAKADNDHPDPSLDWQRFKAGHVVDVHDDDNFFWGTAIHDENGLNWWKIIVLPGVPASEVISLAMGDPVPEPVAPFRLRTLKTDLDALIARALDPVDSAVTLNADQAIQTDKTTLLDLTTPTPPVAVDSVIG